jgi:hypothetical protein
MDLSHIGANRKEVKTIAFANRSPEISVDPATGDSILRIQSANGMGTKGQYDYKIVLTPADLTKLLKTVSLDRSVFADGPLRAELESAVGALLRLVSAASALPFQVSLTAAQLRLQQARTKLEAKPAL